MDFGINSHACKINEDEKELHPCVEQFLLRNGNFRQNQPESGRNFGDLDVHVVDENGHKIGAEVKGYFIMIGKDGEAAFGQALLRKKRRDVEEMFVAFPMSKCKDDNEKLVGNLEERFGEIWKKLRLEEDINELSLMEINKRIYKKVYSRLGIGLLGIMGRVKDGRFVLEKDPAEELYSPKCD